MGPYGAEHRSKRPRLVLTAPSAGRRRGEQDPPHPSVLVSLGCVSVVGQPRSTSLLSPAAIGDANRSRVLQALCDNGPMSRAELAKMAGVTRATIGNIVQALIDHGLVEEGSPEATDGRVGKPGRPVWFGPKAGLSGAVAVTASAVEAAVVNARGDVLDLKSVPLGAAEDADSRAVAVAATTALDAVLPNRDEILGIGVAVPGVCDTATGAVIASGQLPRLSGTGLVDALVRRFDRRVLVDNDSRTQALGESGSATGAAYPRSPPSRPATGSASGSSCPGWCSAAGAGSPASSATPASIRRVRSVAAGSGAVGRPSPPSAGSGPRPARRDCPSPTRSTPRR